MPHEVKVGEIAYLAQTKGEACISNLPTKVLSSTAKVVSRLSDPGGGGA